MKQIDSRTKQSLKARDLYQGTVGTIMVVGCVLIVVVPIILMLLLRRAGVEGSLGRLSNPGIAGGAITFLLFFAQNRAQRALERAGLLREGSEIIERTATAFEGETLEVRETSAWARLGFAAFLLLMVAACYWMWRDRSTSPFELLLFGAGAIACAWLAALLLINIQRPELRMDDEGIIAYQLGATTKRIPWARIASLHRKRIWGLPPDYSFDKKPAETIFLQNAQGKTILMLHAGAMSGGAAAIWRNNPNTNMRDGVPNLPMSACKQRFIAEIERRLRAATPPQREEGSDG